MPSRSLFRPTWILALCLMAPLAAHAENDLTLISSWRGGGTLQDSTTGADSRLRTTAAVTATLDFHYEPSRQIQILASRQRTDLIVQLNGSTTQRMPLTLTYLHIGGTNFFDGPVGRGPYVSGGIGATMMSPGVSGLQSETRASMNLAVGYMWPLGTRVALRFEARGYFTLVNSSGSLFCSSSCALTMKGDLLTQGEAAMGLTFRF